MHCYVRLPFAFNLAFSTGVAIGSRQDIQGLVGFSLLIGRVPRLCLHYGYAFGFVKRIDPAYDLSYMKFYNLVASQVPTIDRFSYANYFGISYNFTVESKKRKIGN